MIYDGAGTHTHTHAHTNTRPCNSGFLVCPVLFLFFWQYLLCLFILQRLQQEHRGFVITVSELLNRVSNSVEITWGFVLARDPFAKISCNKTKTIKQEIKNRWAWKISIREASSGCSYRSAEGPYVWPTADCGYELQGRRLNAQFETFQHTCQCRWGTRWWRINSGHVAALKVQSKLVETSIFCDCFKAINTRTSGMTDSSSPQEELVPLLWLN